MSAPPGGPQPGQVTSGTANGAPTPQTPAVADRHHRTTATATAQRARTFNRFASGLNADPPARPRRDVGRGELGPLELLRWAWRQLTAMRTALLLLFLLAIAAIPGSFVPQRSVDPQRVAGWQRVHPDLTPVFNRIGLFDVYGSVWFSAVYLLLVVSLIGCIVPRTLKYVREIRHFPASLPIDLSRVDSHRLVDIWPRTGAAVLDEAARCLRRRGYKVRSSESSFAAERGRLREIGNLLFHLAFLVVLAGFIYGKLFGFTGAVIVVQGESFTNTRSAYDNFTAGSLVTASDLRPFTLSLRKFSADYLPTGQPDDFDADVTFAQPADNAPAAVGRQQLRVNKPLHVAGTDVFLVGHGYAPVLTVRDGSGVVVYSGPTTFLPQDPSLASYGVVKAPDAQPTALALEGNFYPTFAQSPAGARYSAFPDVLDPRLVLQAYSGDLGMNSGGPQNVYSLVTTGLARLGTVTLSPGQSVGLSGGKGSVTFEGIRPWARLQVSTSPGDRVVLGGVVLALVGLLCSLFVRRRRIWMQAGRGDGVIEIAAVSGRKQFAPDDEELSRLLRRLGLATPRKGQARATSDC